MFIQNKKKWEEFCGKVEKKVITDSLQFKKNAQIFFFCCKDRPYILLIFYSYSLGTV